MSHWLQHVQHAPITHISTCKAQPHWKRQGGGGVVRFFDSRLVSPFSLARQTHNRSTVCGFNSLVVSISIRDSERSSGTSANRARTDALHLHCARCAASITHPLHVANQMHTFRGRVCVPRLFACWQVEELVSNATHNSTRSLSFAHTRAGRFASVIGCTLRWRILACIEQRPNSIVRSWHFALRCCVAGHYLIRTLCAFMVRECALCRVLVCVCVHVYVCLLCFVGMCRYNSSDGNNNNPRTRTGELAGIKLDQLSVRVCVSVNKCTLVWRSWSRSIHT